MYIYYTSLLLVSVSYTAIECTAVDLSVTPVQCSALQELFTELFTNG